MTPLNLTILLQLAGVIVIIAEIIIPSGGLISLIAVGLFGYSLYVVFYEVSTAVGMIFVAADIILIPVLVIVGLKMLARSSMALRTELSSDQGVSSQDAGLADYLNQSGQAISDLRPGGVALINGKRVDVVSTGDYIDKDSEIVVADVTGNQIIVKKKDA